MPKITIIGAGSRVFARSFIGDILLTPELENSTISLYDIDISKLEVMTRLAEKMVEQLGCKAVIEACTDRKEAIKGSDYVITSILVGGAEIYQMDLSIPMKYGVDQSVGDTLGPGGVFRAIRTVPVILEICREMEELCPNAYLLNYCNPAAIITMAVCRKSGIKNVSLCHSVRKTAEDIARYAGISFDEVNYKAAGINHMAWYLEYTWRGRDIYPMLFEAMKNPEIYNKDRIRFDILKYFGYFVTESSYHMSEYVPYFRKSPEIIQKIGKMDSWMKTWEGRCLGYYNFRQEEFAQKNIRQLKGIEPLEMKKSAEYAVDIILGIESGKLHKIYGNMINTGLITNLPRGACVEVPCMIDRNGVTPCYVGDIPTQLAALNRTNISVQELAAEACLTGNKEALLHAVMMDPLTSAVLTCENIKDMVEEMLKAEARYLPQFQ